MSVKISNSLKTYFQNIKLRNSYLIKPKITQDGCLFAVELIVDSISDDDKSKHPYVNTLVIDNVTFLFSSEITQFYPNINELHLDLQKGIKKKPIVTFPAPIVEKRCHK